MLAPNGHAPKPTSTLKLVDVTVRAVDQIGDDAAKGVEEAAAEILRGAEMLAEKLRELAAAIKGQAEIAAEQIGDFVGRATTVLEGINGLQEQIRRGTKQ